MNATLQKKIFLTRVRQWCVDFLVEQGWGVNGLEAHEQYLLETAMRAIRISYKYPALDLQTDREIARYPATLWSHLLSTVGLGKYATYKRVLLNEHLAFPSIEIPPELKVGAYVCHDYRTVIE